MQESFCKKVRNYFREYCQSTTIHGIKYFAEKRTIFERVWWLLVFALCLATCIWSILLVYQKWERSPVIVSFSTKETPIQHIPFPAITVCSESKINQDIFNYSDILARYKRNESFTEQEKIWLSHVGWLCKNYSNLDFFEMLETNATEEPAGNFFESLEELSPRFTITNCQYLGIPWDCDFFFKPIITDEGLCYTYNLLDRRELFAENVVHYKDYHLINQQTTNWTMEHFYQSFCADDCYPNRAMLSGARYAFTFDMKSSPNAKLDLQCNGAVTGYRVLFHIPIRMPMLSLQYISIPMNRSVIAAIRPSLIMTSDPVKAYDPQKRECYFPSERHLKYFTIYSQNNCIMECLTNFTLVMCNCSLFYMPRENSTNICSFREHRFCAFNAEYTMQVIGFEEIITKKPSQYRSDFNDTSLLKKCDCMPMCTDITYNIDSSQTDWDWPSEIEPLEANGSQFSRVTAYFPSGSFIASERNELYGPTDFLANFGGLLGLFTGFSVLSLMEIVYFLSVRLICNTKLYGYWAGPVQN